MPVIGTDGSSINQIRLSLDDGAESHPPRIAVMFSISLLSLLGICHYPTLVSIFKLSFISQLYLSQTYLKGLRFSEFHTLSSSSENILELVRVMYLRLLACLAMLTQWGCVGVILSTAFGHLLPDAFDSLRDKTVRERYPNIEKWTGMIMYVPLLIFTHAQF